MRRILLCPEIIFNEQTFFFSFSLPWQTHTVCHTSESRFQSLIQWSVISTNFRKKMFGQIGNVVGHDRWLTVISIADICFLLKITRQVLHCPLWIDSFSFVYTILLYNSVRSITYPNNPTTTKTWYYLLFEIWLVNFVFLLVCLFGRDLN